MRSLTTCLIRRVLLVAVVLVAVLLVIAGCVTTVNEVPIRTVTHGGAVTSVAFSSDGLHLLSGGFDQTLKL